MKATPCTGCCQQRRITEKPNSFVARLWRWHTRFCPHWKAYMQTLSPEEQQAVIEKFHLKR